MLCCFDMLGASAATHLPVTAIHGTLSENVRGLFKARSASVRKLVKQAIEDNSQEPRNHLLKTAAPISYPTQIIAPVPCRSEETQQENRKNLSPQKCLTTVTSRLPSLRSQTTIVRALLPSFQLASSTLTAASPRRLHLIPSPLTSALSTPPSSISAIHLPVPNPKLIPQGP